METPAPGKVLIVEPDEQARLVLQHLMAVEGYLTFPVASADTALLAADQHDFDLVLLSARTSLGPDGAALVKKLRGRHPELQSILLMDESCEQSRLPEEFKDDTSVDVIRRSMGPDYLAAFAKNALEYKRLLSALERLSDSGKIKLAKRNKPA